MSAFTIYFAQIAGLYFLILGVILLVRKRAIIEPLSKSEWVSPDADLAVASLCSAGAHLSAPAYTKDGSPRAGAVKNGRS